MLEARLEFVTKQISGCGDTTSQQMAGQFVRALRVAATDHGEAVEAAQPLVTVAANLAQLEVISIAESEIVAAATGSVAE